MTKILKTLAVLTGISVVFYTGAQFAFAKDDSSMMSNDSDNEGSSQEIFNRQQQSALSQPDLSNELSENERGQNAENRNDNDDNMEDFTITNTPFSFIQIVQVDRPNNNPAVGSSFNVTPTIISPDQSLNNVDVRVSLVDQANMIKFNKVFSGVTLTQNQQQSFSLPVSNIQAGTYNIRLDVFDQNGNIMQSFNNLGTIVVM